MEIRLVSGPSTEDIKKYGFEKAWELQEEKEEKAFQKAIKKLKKNPKLKEPVYIDAYLDHRSNKLDKTCKKLGLVRDGDFVFTKKQYKKHQEEQAERKRLEDNLYDGFLSAFQDTHGDTEAIDYEPAYQEAYTKLDDIINNYYGLDAGTFEEIVEIIENYRAKRKFKYEENLEEILSDNEKAAPTWSTV